MHQLCFNQTHALSSNPFPDFLLPISCFDCCCCLSRWVLSATYLYMGGGPATRVWQASQEPRLQRKVTPLLPIAISCNGSPDMGGNAWAPPHPRWGLGWLHLGQVFYKQSWALCIHVHVRTATSRKYTRSLLLLQIFLLWTLSLAGVCATQTSHLELCSLLIDAHWPAVGLCMNHHPLLQMNNVPLIEDEMWTNLQHKD